MNEDNINCGIYGGMDDEAPDTLAVSADDSVCDYAPSPRRITHNRLLEYNPFYLLSAMCMLAGLFALNGSLNWSPLPEANLLLMLGTLNLYEFLLIGLGIFLFRRGLVRDAATLFILEAFFLVDAGFLNSELFTRDFGIGFGINAMLLILGACKVAAVFRGMRLSLADGRYPLILIQLLILLGIPGVCKYLSSEHGGVLPATALYGIWWVVGLLPVLYLVLHRADRAYWHRGVVGAFVLLPAVSILAHLCTTNWVYHVRWYSPNLAPLLLGLAVAMGVCDRHVRNVTARMWLQLTLPVIAIALSLQQVSLLLVHLGQIPITPLRFILFGAVVVYIHGLFVHRHPYFAVAGAMCLGAAGIGESPQQMAQSVQSITRTGSDVAWKIIPSTITQWGFVSVVASFVLLGFGLIMSLLRAERKAVPETVE